MTWQWVILTISVAFLAVSGAAAVAIPCIIVLVRALREARASLEQLGRDGMDRILALKDYQAFGLVNQPPKPPPRRTKKVEL